MKTCENCAKAYNEGFDAGVAEERQKFREFLVARLEKQRRATNGAVYATATKLTIEAFDQWIARENKK